ncbi:MAG: UDP-N-acetylmuramate--L-alanine ligase [Kiritimatiellae bacterium]|nr:UDP-N-acetylmuramate--L-alanine ligase [Kiritimatiellia bacterium]
MKSKWLEEHRGRVHFTGVCGVGMAGVARLLHDAGWKVDGCDGKPDPTLKAWLEAGGIPVASGHSPGHLDASLAAVVATPAVHPDAPERRAAQDLGVPVFMRGEVLASILSARRGVAVCGAHGKTTTSCFAARLLQALGDDPSWCIGGTTRSLGGVAHTGSEILVAEADESDGTLALYHPAITVVNAIDPDHLDFFRTPDELLACFRSVVGQTREGVAVCSDSPLSLQAVSAVPAGVRLLRFGMGEGAELRGTDLSVSVDGVAFGVAWQGRTVGRVRLPCGGAHNVLNALGALAAAVLAGHAVESAVPFLEGACSELPGRRFETVARIGSTEIIADYAHHPVELRAAVSMAKERNPAKLTVVFQPHRYSRTKALGAQFPEAFRGADELILLPVYAASEAPLEGGRIADLYAHFRAAAVVPRLCLAQNMEEAWRYLRRHLPENGILLLAGAGDIIEMSERIRRDAATGMPGEVEIPGAQRDVPLADKTFFGCGGSARFFVDAADETVLAEVLKVCREAGVPWRVLGAGANTWAGDLGYDGCVIRLAGGAPEVRDGVVCVPAGMRGSALLAWCEREGWGGLEFLDSVPGTVGGWLAMNAGAHGGEIGGCVAWIRCLKPDGENAILSADAWGFGYRVCRALAPVEGGCPVAVSCGLRLSCAKPEEVRQRREAFRARRIPLAGLRTEGSVFRNPPGDHAGRVLEAAGCKGLRIGGASVTSFHANIIAAEKDATASDVLALVRMMRSRALDREGVRLEPEITGFLF